MKLGRAAPQAVLLSAVTLAVTAAASDFAGAAPRELAGARLLAHSDGAQSLGLVLTPRLRDPAGAAAFAAAVSRPGDPLYRRFLTPQQFADRFAMSQADYDKLVAWAVARGFTVVEKSLGRTSLSISGPAAAAEQAFAVRINDYRAADGARFHAPDRDPAIPVEIAARVSGVVGLSDRVRFAPLARIQKLFKSAGPVTEAAGGTGVGGAFSPQDLRTAYRISTQPSSTPTETIALFEQGGFRFKGLNTYYRQYNLPRVPVQARIVNGQNAVYYVGIELEALLDLDMVITANPNAKQILVYEDAIDPYQVALLSSLTAMANDNKAQTVSISYGIDEAMAGPTQIAAEAVLFQQLAAQGVAVFVSSGDQGAYGRALYGYNVSDPASQPFVTAVGGTTLHTFSDQSYWNEQVWNNFDVRGFGGATGGGVSAYWSLPDYQRFGGPGTLSVAVANGGSNVARNIPDISSIGDQTTGVSVYTPYYGWAQVGGTSVSSPLDAGLYSLLDNASRTVGLGGVGFFNPLLYRLETQQTGVAFDVFDGSNGNASIFLLPGYSAGIGYDNSTGWGSPEGKAIIYSPIQNRGSGPGSPPPVTTAKLVATATTLALSWPASPGATGYLIWGENITYGGQSNINATATPSTTLAGLVPASLYTTHILAVNPAGTTEAQTPFYFYTKYH